MGVYNFVHCLFGIKFTFDELKHIKQFPEFVELANEIGCNTLINLFCEYFNDALITLIIDDNYKFEEYQNYYLGKEIDFFHLRDGFDMQQYTTEIKKICDKYNLKYMKLHNFVEKC